MRTIFSFKTSLLALLSLLLVAAGSLAQAGDLSDLQGKPQKLQDHLGNNKWTVVMFWTSDCHVCNAEAHEYVAFQEKHKNGNIRMLGITLDGQANIEAARGFAREHKLNFVNLIGEPETVGGLYYEMTGNFFAGTPTFMIISPQSKVLAADAGAIPPSIIEDFISSQAVAVKQP